MRENVEKKKNRALEIIKVFENVYGNADCTLDYTSALQLLIATQLAAQCTDARVNLVTPALFDRYKSVYDFANADEDELADAGYEQVDDEEVDASYNDVDEDDEY